MAKCIKCGKSAGWMMQICSACNDGSLEEFDKAEAEKARIVLSPEVHPRGHSTVKKNYPAAGVLLILGSILSTCSGGHDPTNPSPVNMITLVAGIVAAALAFAGTADKTRISLASLALVGALLMAYFARGYWMPGGLPLFDITAVLLFILALVGVSATSGWRHDTRKSSNAQPK